MLIHLFYLMRPIIDVVGVITLFCLCLGASLYAVVMIIRRFYRFFLTLGVLCLLFFILYLGTDGFAFLNTIF